MELNLAPYLPLLNLIHVLAVMAFVLFHGVSGIAALQLRRERDRERVIWLVGLSSAMLRWSWLPLAIVFFGGILAGIAGGWWTSGRLWIWASLGVFVAVTVLMNPLASSYMEAVRQAVGLPTFQDRRQKRPPSEPVADGELAAVLDSGKPLWAAVVGVGGIVVLTWLMMAKPL